jgi:hypothetical protein
MTTLLTGTLERTVGWFNPEAHVEPEAQFRRTVSPSESVHGETQSGAEHTHAQRVVPLELRLRQWLCAATRGHAFIMGIDGPRMYLICQHCFHETSGWDVARRPPRVRS